jgi:DNA-directed RNA polymerase subunit M/transcription elongation factor TFIIS
MGRLAPAVEREGVREGMVKELICVHKWVMLAYDPEAKDGSMTEIKKCQRCGESWRSTDNEPRVVVMRLE